MSLCFSPLLASASGSLSVPRYCFLVDVHVPSLLGLSPTSSSGKDTSERFIRLSKLIHLAAGQLSKLPLIFFSGYGIEAILGNVLRRVSARVALMEPQESLIQIC